MTNKASHRRVYLNVTPKNPANGTIEIFDELAYLEYGVRNTNRNSFATVEFKSRVNPNGSIIWPHDQGVSIEDVGYKALVPRYCNVLRGKWPPGDRLISVSTSATGKLRRQDPVKLNFQEQQLEFEDMICKLRIEKELTILMLLADITAIEPYGKFDREANEVDKCLKDAPNANRISCHIKVAVQQNSFSKAIMCHRPQIVHFCCHGDTEGNLIVTDKEHHVAKLEKQDFANLFKYIATCVRCVVLNACFTVDQAEIVTEHVECAIGTTGKITNPQAITFANKFYEVIAYSGASIEDAFNYARDSSGNKDGFHLFSRNDVEPSKLRLLAIA